MTLAAATSDSGSSTSVGGTTTNNSNINNNNIKITSRTGNPMTKMEANNNSITANNHNTATTTSTPPKTNGTVGGGGGGGGGDSTSSAAPNESLPTSELSLLAKLEAANKLIESDAKSLNSLQSSVHSRKNSDTSQISFNSEEDIWSMWAAIVTDWEGSLKRRTPDVRELVRRGIPHHFRAIVWQLLCGASEHDKKQYAEYIKATSACEKVIRRDIARTYPEHDFFKVSGLVRGSFRGIA